MRSMIVSVLIAVAVLIAQPTHAFDTKNDAFRQCTENSVLWTLRQTDGKFDKTKVINEVLADCILNAPNDVLPKGPRNDAWMAKAKQDIAALIGKLESRAKAEKADQDRIGAAYYLCLLRRAKALSLASDEAADIIAQASLSACPTERSAVFEVQKRYNDNWTEQAMKAMESVLARRLLLEIVAARAQRSVPPVPTPTPSEPSVRRTPI